ncbi:YheT family hydrolase [Gelidibacter pelagius]|uniref:Alpha/beta fold hydrolase n=1 Tax=Gelidibacter pelagius TaxID=2819985 RepID=A0ABS3SR82_9FLAO|nr:alpha/beta fold hydrolase [Gelidibacter pelagius]MBO3098222.1 alpha/beta fold hydrolase [Gelidibacter pelagius]
MPILDSIFKPPFYFRKSFVATVYSGLFRKVNLEQTRERLELADGDFIDLDWSYAQKKSEKVIILLSGLEGHAQRPYLTGTAKLFNKNGIDAISVNFRGCSGEPNRKYYAYHSGATEDLHTIIMHAIKDKNYAEIYLYGISLGGNLALKYLGERDDVPSQIKACIGISVPCSLQHSAKQLHSFINRPFHDRFKKRLVNSLRVKQSQFPDQISEAEVDSIKTLNDFDEVYTSRAHGFKNALDYYEKSSCLQFLPNIKVPSLIINALNDSFLTPECFPVKAAKNNPNLYLEMPKHGGHVGFINRGGVYYNEKRALEFVKENTK